MLGRDAGPLFQQYASLLEDELGDLATLDRELQTALDAVRAERRQVCTALAAVYLPELSPEALADAEARTGFRGFRQRKPLDAMEREAKKLQARVVGLEADEKWKRREALVGPHGTYTRALAEAKDMLDPWERDCQRFEQLDGFLELVEVGYDTPGFEERWWQPAYWRHWALGDKICAALGMDDFGDDVLPAYEVARAPRDKWKAEVTRIEANVHGVHAHAQERDRTAWRLENLATIYLEECRSVLADHIERADVPLLATWAGDDRGVLVHLKRLSGLGAKRDILDEMRGQWVKPARDMADATRARFVVKAQKLARPKKWNVPVVVPATFEEKLQQRVARREKARAYVRRVVRYDDYDRFDLSQPPETWWLHMNDNRRPGVFTPRLRTWYDRHPDVVVVTDADWAEDRGAAALTATEALSAAGDIS